jgi:predicted enzyme related to lactoylglutathione lyase
MGPDQRWVEVAPRGAATSMTLVTWFETMPPGSLRGLVLETEDLEGTIDEIAERGHRVDGEILDAPWGRYVTLEDPDGNGLIIQSTLA